MTISFDPVSVSQRRVKRISQAQPDIFHGMMIVDIDITPGSDIQIKKTMGSKKRQHMIKKRNPGRYRPITLSIDIQMNVNVSLCCLSFDITNPVHARSLCDAVGKNKVSFLSTSPGKVNIIVVHAGNPSTGFKLPSSPDSVILVFRFTTDNGDTIHTHKSFQSGPLSLKISTSPLTRVFLPFALGYYLSYLYRIVNAVIAPDLMASTGIGPSDLGLLTATFFLSFALFQLPLGLVLDRYGPRRVEAILLVTASAGALIFGLSHGLIGLMIGRSLIGLGVSACLMAAFTAFVSWFPGHRLPLINGLIMAAGGMGAISATTPVQLMLHVMHWRTLFFILAGLTILTAWIVFRVVPEKPQSTQPERFRDAINGIREIFTSRVFWAIGIWATASQAAFLAVIGLWIGPWLRDVGGLDRDSVANTMFQVTLMMVFGYIFTGRLTGQLAKKGFPTLPVAAIGMSVFMVVQAWLILNITSGIHLAWLLFGFTGTTGILCYAELTRQFSSHLAGRVNTALNLLVFVAAFAGQWGIGAILERYPPTAAPSGLPDGYQIGFALLLFFQLFGMIWYGVNYRRLKTED